MKFWTYLKKKLEFNTLLQQIEKIWAELSPPHAGELSDGEPNWFINAVIKIGQ